MIRVFEPKLRANDIFSVLKTLLNNNISGTSPVVAEFEQKLADNFDRNYVSAVANGSVALDLAFQVLDLKEGDEVIVPSFTIISCLSAVLRTKAKVVFCDVDSETWNMNLDGVISKVTKKTRAVLMVHTYGIPADAIKISKFCEDNDLILIEDSAEAHGQFLNDKKCGSFGLISTLSFYSNKHITTGEGGAVLTDSEEIHNKIQQMKNLDFVPHDRFNHENLYWNYRLGGLQAALGLSQINNMNKTISLKIEQGNYYSNLLSNYTDKVTIPIKSFEGSQNHYWVYGIVIKKEGLRNQLMRDLLSIGIETRPFFWPLHLQKYIQKNFKQDQQSLVISENLGKNGLYIPTGSHVNKRMQDRIVISVIELIDNY